MRHSVFLLGVLLLVGCSASSSVRGDADRISLEEIEASSTQTALDLIRQLRPTWFRQSGRDYSTYARGTERQGIVIYLDGQRYGKGRSSLSSISVSRIDHVNFLDAGEALGRYGRGHEEGAIQIISRSQADRENK